MTFIKRISMLMIVMLSIAACGGDTGSDGAGDSEKPTATAFPTFAFVEPTLASAFDSNDAADTDVESADVVELDPVKVERGLGRYEALECATCHGEQGEGTDDGSALVGYSAPEAEFVDFMRTGGELGNDHLYSSSTLSNSGISNLYQYLISLE